MARGLSDLQISILNIAKIYFENPKNDFWWAKCVCSKDVIKMLFTKHYSIKDVVEPSSRVIVSKSIDRLCKRGLLEYLPIYDKYYYRTAGRNYRITDKGLNLLANNLLLANKI
jgi:hypothetical protein